MKNIILFITCLLLNVIAVKSQVNPNCPLYATINKEDANGTNCYKGKVIVEVFNYTPPITYWVENRNTNQRITQPISTNNSIFIIENLTHGDYCIKIKDSRPGCPPICVEFSINGPNGLEVIINNCNDIQRQSCNGPWTVRAHGKGGQPGYNYCWTNAQGTTVSSSSTLYTNDAGVYTITITDANNCVVTKTIYVGPMEIESAIIIDADCNNQSGEISINTKGAVLDCIACPSLTPAIRMHLTRTDGQNFSGQDLPNVQPTYDIIPLLELNYSPSFPNAYYTTTDKNFTIKNLKPGKYKILLKDRDRQCSIEYEFEIKMNLPKIDNILIQAIDCMTPNTGGLMASVSGGKTPYVYEWVKNGSVLSGETSSSLYGLSSGNYTLKVTDTEGCSAIKHVKLHPALDNNNAELLTQKCFIDKFGKWRVETGFAEFQNAGTAPFTFSWSHMSSDTRTTTLNPGQTVTVTITDANGCSAIYTITAIVCSGPNQSPNKIGIASPNPNSGNFIAIITIESVAQETDLKVIDMYGNTLFYEDKGVLDVGTYNFLVDISLAPTGTYYLLINNGEINIPFIKN